MDNFYIRVDKVIPQKKLGIKLIQLIQVLQNNNVNLYLESIKLIAPEVIKKNYDLPLTKNNLEIFKSQLKKFVLSNYKFKPIYITIHDAPASFSIVYGNEYNDSALSCQTHFFSYPKKKAFENLKKLIGFAFLATNFMDANIFIGGIELDYSIWDPTNKYFKIYVIGSKSDYYINYLQEHLNSRFSLNLQKNEIEKLVKENATFMEKQNGFTIISFVDFKKTDLGYKMINTLYETIQRQNT